MTDDVKKRDIMREVRADALTIPNIIGYFRILLIPVFAVLYAQENFASAVLVLIASALSDITDGRIARKYNAVTDLGKLIDPVADKLTQAAMIICLASKFPAMWSLLAVLAVREAAMLVISWDVLRKTDTVNSACWYGKLCTGVIYAVMMLHVMQPDLSVYTSNVLISLCAALIVLSFFLYTARFIRILQVENAKKDMH